MKISDKVLIFDYPQIAPNALENRGLLDGILELSDLKDEEVYIFVSHAHADHYSDEIFSWLLCGFMVYEKTPALEPTPRLRRTSGC